MPYTPPSKQSPAPSRADSPNSKKDRPQSFQLQPPRPVIHNGPPRPHLPRSNSSTSYLQRARRSPSLSNQPGLPTPDPTPENQTFDDRPAKIASPSSLRQSPPPWNDLTIPSGAMISPPDSGQNSSDDEDPAKAGRRRQLENLAELRAAIHVIEQQREGSPARVEEERRRARASLGLVVPSTGADSPKAISSPPLSTEARKISHSRSNTESVIVDMTRPLVDSPERSSESDDEYELPRHKPPMLRKKSGELVRPALRPASARRRPSSMPGTPTYSKAVHFDQHLEHVKHFLQVDRPLAVSANNSPVDQYDDETEFPFGVQPREPRWEWEIKLPNFPREGPPRFQLPVRVERVYLAPDKKTMIGVVAVQNLAFHKNVTARFTLDYWKTVSEVTAEYSHDVRRQGINDGCDRFQFHLRLEDHVNLENKMLFFCVRYNVNGQEFWDSNDGLNYQVEFTKKICEPKNGNPRPVMAISYGSTDQGPMTAPGGRQRPVSMPNFDDFATGFEAFTQPPLRLRPGKKQDAKAEATGSDRIVPDAPGLRQKTPKQAFGHRYDFGASLSAAIQAASSALGERSGIPSSATAGPRPADLAKDKPPLQSQSYNELIDKYCFFGSGKPSPATVRLSAPVSARSATTPAVDSPAAEPSEPPPAASPPPSSNSSSTMSSEQPSPAIEEKQKAPARPSATSSVRVSRSPSPVTGHGLGSRTASPLSFGYPYHQPMGQLGGFAESTAPTATCN